MKDFLKYVLATITGLVVLGLLITISSVVTLLGMSMQTSTVQIPDNAVLTLRLNGTLVERAEENPFAQLFGNTAMEEQGLEDMLVAVRHAAENDNVKGIYLEAGALSGATPAMLEELRHELVEFKKTGKFIVSYGDTYTQGTYYICSVADSVVINPQGMLDWKGLSMQSVFVKDLLDKVGVKMQVFKVGTYKSAVEPVILNEMSEANREQLNVMSGEIWDKITSAVAKSRKITVDKLNALADTATIFCDAEFYKEEKLVDKLAYSDEVPGIIAAMMEVEDKDDYSTVGVTEMANAAGNEPKDESGDIIAVYYAYGDIVQDASSGYGNAEIVGSKVVRDLKKLAEDDDVKAVVLRVNSGGGSAYASEQIWHQVMNIKSEKPIVVSMGGMAASGGYYISCAADWIVAEPTTLTGSIGIFGMFPEASELLNDKLGIHFQSVKTNKYSDFGDISRPMNAGEQALVQGYINRGYELFTKRCADGRKMKQDKIKAVAEGRVWTGVHAKQIGLVDQLGGLEDAIAVAKEKAELDKCTVMSYPKKSSVFDQLLNQVQGGSYADAKMQEAFGDYYNMLKPLRRISEKGTVEASVPYYLIFNL
ncbi:MAG: signal peptide peptidase SppA [Bacteroides sp.]|nr:signal peptide peptidase SppA [Roseburia sp.]MCM1347395.1 signal peptide peptidase SppA [Bacteroides sp.]MCM1421889.1 signal peptide peptidase SppA [Bacteroides sp.]